MTPVDQEFVGENVIGDCVRAATASILDLPITEVPHFVADQPGEEWYETWEKFVISHGRNPAMTIGPWDTPPKLRGYYLASGICERRGERHMVVMNGGELAHDPHPSRAGLLKTEAIWLMREL